MISRDLSVSVFQTGSTVPHAGDQNSGSHACMAGALVAEPSSNPHIMFSVLKFITTVVLMRYHIALGEDSSSVPSTHVR